MAADVRCEVGQRGGRIHLEGEAGELETRARRSGVPKIGRRVLGAIMVKHSA